MITCRLIQLKPYLTGYQTCHETRLSGDSLQCGRGAACQIHLPDHRVSLLHATLLRLDDGSLQIEAAQGKLINVNGFMERRATLTPGTLLLIGPYRLTVQAVATDADLTLSVALSDLGPDRNSLARQTPVTLADLGLSKRRFGIGLVVFILLGLLVLPLWTRVSPAFEAWQARLPVALTGWLSPGPLSPSHGLFGMQCSSCHSTAFTAVADLTCKQCHRQTAPHLRADSSHSGVLDQLRCANCHQAHAGKVAALPSEQSQCVACHQRLDADVAKVTDFSAHPAFHLTLVQGKTQVRVRQNEKSLPPEQNGLKFSHLVHLDGQGISSPDGRTVLRCGNCHLLEDSGQHFAPLRMELTCQQSRCHKLRFEDPVGGLVPHGSERELMSRLRQHFQNELADAPQKVARDCADPTRSGAPNRRMLDCAEQLANRFAAASLFLKTGDSLQCVLCHAVTDTGRADLPWKVAPVRLGRDWQAKASFSHAKHGSMLCKQCHDKANSKLSEDIAMPTLQSCRNCHTGQDGAARTVASPCQSCHRFHRE